jgi:NAD(P)-dependent dehydrogenase (short-subunit alcohol dehydrogenase family)
MSERYRENQEQRPAQHQPEQPGSEQQMTPRPIFIRDDYRGSGKLSGRVALISGGDSGIGRSVAVHFAREGADVAIIYLDEDEDAEETRRLVEQEGRRCLTLRGDLADSGFCDQSVARTRDQLGRLDVLVSNAAEQHSTDDPSSISDEQLRRTFETNVFGCFYLIRAALPLLGRGSAIINTTSVTAYRGSGHLVDYAGTKAAIVGLTRSFAKSLVEKEIRVNAVAPGPIWTPLIPATFDADRVEQFGESDPMNRAGQPAEVGPCYVFLASADASFMTGQVLHPNGGEYVSS